MRITPQPKQDEPEYPDLRRHMLDKRCRRRKITIAVASLIVLGSASVTGYELAQEIIRGYGTIPLAYPVGIDGDMAIVTPPPAVAPASTETEAQP